jgi:hypothetical protein
MKFSTKAAILIISGVVQLAQGVSIYFDTTSSGGWAATAGGAFNATPYVVANGFGGRSVTITSSANNSGTFLPGGSLANFSGYWSVMYSFTLPANAANVQMSYSNFSIDDRGVLLLNGNIVDSVGLPVNNQYDGSLVLTDGGVSQPFTYNGGPSKSGSVSSGFISGGVNTIQGIINNTGNGVLGQLNSLAFNNGTGFALYATVSYTLVPEPSAAAVTFLGFCCLAGFGVFQTRRMRAPSTGDR